MKNVLTILFIIIIHSLSIAQQEKRIALVIGNAQYKNGNSLKNPVNDAELMARTLQSLHFQVIKKINADRKEMNEAIIDFSKKAKNCDVALFYYAGHGIQVDGINYVIPVDSKISEPVAVQFEALKVDNIVSQFEYYPNHANIVILDACRENPFLSWVRGGMNSFAPANAPRGTIIAFATGNGSVAYDGTNSTNGLYTGILAKQMLIPQRIEDVFINTRNQVYDASKGKQQPQEWSQLSGAFFFVKGDITSSTKKPIEFQNGIVLVSPVADGQLYIDNKLITNLTAGKNISIDTLSNGMRKLEIRGQKYWCDSLFITKGLSTTNSEGPTFSIEDFDNSASGQFTDYTDQIKYKWTKIGKQIWMAENCKKFIDDENSFCYHYDKKYLNQNGMYYRWNGALKACPSGWHLPSTEEYQELLDFLGNNREIGHKLKSAATKDSSAIYWNNSKSLKIDNDAGFSALPVGILDSEDVFTSPGKASLFWTSSPYGKQNAWYFLIVDFSDEVRLDYWPISKGFPVRCVKDK